MDFKRQQSTHIKGLPAKDIWTILMMHYFEPSSTKELGLFVSFLGSSELLTLDFCQANSELEKMAACI